MSDDDRPSFGDRIAYPGLLLTETGTWLDLKGVAHNGAMPFPIDVKIGLSTAYAVRARLIVNGPGSYVGLTPSGREAFNRVKRFIANNSN